MHFAGIGKLNTQGSRTDVPAIQGMEGPLSFDNDLLNIDLFHSLLKVLVGLSYSKA